MPEIIGIAGMLFMAWLGISDYLSTHGPRRGKPSQPPFTAPKARTSVRTEPVNRPVPPQPAIDLTNLPPDIIRLISGLPDRSLEELQRQWLNAIGMIDRAGPEKAAPYVVFRNALSAEWARRMALAEADPRAFPWPSTKAPKGKSGLDSGEWHLIGMLSYLGYRVGATNGVTPGIRHQILDLCFGAALPPLNGLSYMREWGPPGTPPRLRKLANELASFARNGKRKRAANLAYAVADWEADLDYLYRRYYVRKCRFAWPRVD